MSTIIMKDYSIVEATFKCHNTTAHTQIITTKFAHLFYSKIKINHLVNWNINLIVTDQEQHQGTGDNRVMAFAQASY